MAAPVEVFYSYAHKDERLRQKLETHLSTLRQQGFILPWHDRNISAGTDWEREIDVHLILLLISPDFIASTYCTSIEARRAMERHQAGLARRRSPSNMPTARLFMSVPNSHLASIPG